MFEYLTIFCVNGNTLRFNKVSNLRDDVFGDLQFDYKSESTGMSCHAVFDQADFIGYSYVRGKENE